MTEETGGFYRRHGSLSKPARTNVLIGTVLDPQVQRLYSLAVFDAELFKVVEAPELDPAKRTPLAEYFFRVPPKSYEISEPQSTHIVYTQDNGKFVEAHGSLSKDIRLTGTTGLRPNKAAPTAIPLFEAARTLVSPEALLARSSIPFDREATGFDDIIFLRNLFRFYSDNKHSNVTSKKTIFLFRNAKDDDYWVVEPMEFKLSTTSSSPLTYEYHIQLRTIAQFDYQLVIPPDPLEDRRAKERARARLAQSVRTLGNFFFLLNNQVNKIRGRYSYISNNVLVPLASLVNGLSSLLNQSKNIERQVSSDISKLRGSLNDMINQLDEDLGDPNSAGRLLLGSPVYEMHRTAVRLVVELASLQTNPLIPVTVASEVAPRKARYTEAYTRTDDLAYPRRSPDVVGPSYLGNQSEVTKVTSGVVNAGESIRDVAARLLNDRSRWQILVTLNGLRAPYISTTGGEGVLRPGDRILFPARTDDATAPSQLTSESEPSQDPILSAYGVDLRLASIADIGGSQVELASIALSPTGDFDLIRGIDNVRQAMQLKFATEQGSLTVHPRYGSKFAIGTKATPSSFNEYRINTQATLLTDNRIKAIRSLEFFAEGDVLAVNVVCELVASDNLLSTNFIVRR